MASIYLLLSHTTYIEQQREMVRRVLHFSWPCKGMYRLCWVTWDSVFRKKKIQFKPERSQLLQKSEAKHYRAQATRAFRASSAETHHAKTYMEQIL